MAMFEDFGAQAISAQFNRMTDEQKEEFKSMLIDAESGLHTINAALSDNTISGEELNNGFIAAYASLGKPAYRGVVAVFQNALNHLGDFWK
jgi:hypothetical protein